jgi:hypothetical protein
MYKKNLLLISFLFLITGCATTYTYDNQQFSSAEKALAAQQTLFTSIEENINVFDKEKFQKILLLTPSKETCEALGITKTGAPKKEILDYISSVLTRDYAKFGDYLRKSKLSNVTNSKIVDYPKTESRQYVNQYDAVIYLHMLSPSQISWYLVTKDMEPTIISMDPMAKDVNEKIASWLNAINTSTTENT